MPTILHNLLSTTDLHEPKGVSTAAANDVYMADGAGSGTWQHAAVHGGWRYADIGTGTTYTAPTAYTLMNVAGVTTTLHDFTNNSLGRLTYTGTPTRNVHMVLDASVKHSTGSGQEIFFEVYKNGVATSSVNVITADSGNYQHIAMHYDGEGATNDYFEIFLKTSTGNVIIHAAYMYIMGVIA